MPGIGKVRDSDGRSVDMGLKRVVSVTPKKQQHVFKSNSS
jgi:hypothetical protein